MTINFILYKKKIKFACWKYLITLTILCSKSLIYFNNKLFDAFDKLEEKNAKLTNIYSFLKIQFWNHINSSSVVKVSWIVLKL